MTREEEILNKAISYSEIEGNFFEFYDCCGDVCDDKEFIEQAFIKSAKWADETMIEKACEWLLSQEEMIGISFEDDFIERFKKAMGE